MNVLNDHGVVLSGKDLVDYAKRRGLCQLCGRTQTHRRSKNLFKKLKNHWQPLTIEDEGADDSTFLTNRTQSQRYLVYKGLCLQPTCYSLDEAKRELGELPALPSDGASSRRNFDMDVGSIRSSLHKYSSARFSTTSSTRSNTSYEFSIKEQQKVTPVHNRLLRAPSTVSDVSSLGASAVSEDYEEENPYLREFKVQHVTGSKHFDVVNSIGKFHTNTLEPDLPDPAGKQVDGHGKERTIAGESDTMSESETSGSEESDSSLNSLDSTSMLNARGSFQESAPIKLPENYDVKVSPKRSSLLTIHRGSLRVLNLENSVTESTLDLSAESLDSTDAEEEGIEIALAPSMDADELPPKISNHRQPTPPSSGGTHLRTNVMKKVLAEASKISTKLSRDEHEKTDDDSNGVLTVFQSAPLAYVHPTTRRKHSFPLLDFEHESSILSQSFADAKRIGRKVTVETEIATFDRLSAFFAQGGRKVLHLSCYGHPEYFLLENGYGSAHPLLVQDLKRFVSKAELDLVFVSACHSEATGEAFLNAGAKHVVCCRLDSLNGRDERAAEFTRHFYKALACRKTLQEAFDHAKDSVGRSSLHANRENQDKFLLLPEESNHNVTISFAEKRCPTNSRLNAPSQASQNRLSTAVLKGRPKHFVGRGEDLFQLLDALRIVDWVHVHGEQGVGKTTLVAAAAEYISKRHSFFLSDRIIWVNGPEEAKEWRKSDSRKKTSHTPRPLIIFDARIESDAWTKSRKAKFVLEVLSSGSQVKMISIGCDESIINQHRANSTFPPRSLQVGRLNHQDSACLFSTLMTSSDYTSDDLASILSMPNVHSKPAFAMDDGAGTDDSRIVVDALMNYRKNKVYQRIGAGLPKSIVHMASSMPKEELEYCIRWANKANEVPDTASIEFPATRAQLEEIIQCTLARESRALRHEDYAQARECRESLEELQSLRSVLLTRQTLEKVLETVRPKLQEAIQTRLYEQAEVLRNRRNYLERQLKRENDYLKTEENFQQARRRASSFRSSASSCRSVSSRGSVHSTSSRASLRSASSRSSIHSRTSQSSRSSRVSFGPSIEIQ